MLWEREVLDGVGEEGIERLIREFYAQVPDDSILGPMYPADEMEEAEVRLRDFIIGRLGGPQRYIEQRGHPRLRQRHMPFEIDEAARDRWVELMENAFARSDFPEELGAPLRQFFGEVATFLINRR